MRYQDLVAIIGAEKARRLVALRGGERLPRKSAAVRDHRNARIRAVLDRGASTGVAGEQHGVSRRHVQRIGKAT